MSVRELPGGYSEIFSVNLQANKKMAVGLNVAATVVAGAMAVLAHFFIVPITELFDMSGGLGFYFLRFGIIVIALILYIILHEAVHGVAMKLCGTEKIKYGFTGLYAFAGSDDYYTKGCYLFIALAPVVLWGAVLAVANIFVPASWFWVIYIVQISNISGAVGDVYVTAKFAKMPSDILVRDSGVAMTVYSNRS